MQKKHSVDTFVDEIIPMKFPLKVLETTSKSGLGFSASAFRLQLVNRKILHQRQNIIASRELGAGKFPRKRALFD